MLIDVSGSMGSNNRLANAKSGAVNFINLIASGAALNTGFTTKIGLIKFSDDSQILVTPTLNYASVISQINALALE